MPNLETLIKNLKSHDEVDAVFLTGSHGTSRKPYSDIDLIIILKDTNREIESIFTWIDGTFADIYFFDLENIDRILQTPWTPTYTDEIKHFLDDRLYSWIKQGTIMFDKSGKLTELQSTEKELKVLKDSKINAWNNINYDYESNRRYFESNDSLYHEALQLRLLYGVANVFTNYFYFKNKPWRGEKKAIKYFKENDNDFYNILLDFIQSNNLDGKFKSYEKMVKFVLSIDPEYKLWEKKDILVKPVRGQMNSRPELRKFWECLIS